MLQLHREITVHVHEVNEGVENEEEGIVAAYIILEMAYP